VASVRLGLIGYRPTPTNRALVAACRRLGLEAALLSPGDALASLRPPDLAIGRLDVRPTFDGVEDGLWQLRRLERAGIRLFNRAGPLLAAHDKLATTEALGGAGLPHPPTRHLDPGQYPTEVEFPVVLKPRFGSWGGDVVLCEDDASLRRSLAELGQRGWYQRHGVLLQSFVRSPGYDLRLVVAGRQVLGAVRRVPPPGEWRTNVMLGASRVPLDPPARACGLALAATAALGLDLAGVDLLPTDTGDEIVLEVNGAVEFTRAYLRGADVFTVALTALLARARKAEQALA
jgi:RimK family alpha-L-glutamate ligase